MLARHGRPPGADRERRRRRGGRGRPAGRHRLGPADRCGSCTASSRTRCTPSSAAHGGRACTSGRPAHSRSASSTSRRTSWSSSLGTRALAGMAVERSGGRPAPATTPSTSSHPSRPRSTTASRSRWRHRSTAPTPSAPTCSCGWATRSTAPAIHEALETLEHGADLARRSGADGSAHPGGASPPTAGSCGSTATRPEYLGHRRGRGPRSPTRPTSRPTPDCSRSWPRASCTPRRPNAGWPRARRRSTSRPGHDDPTLLARIAPPVLYALWAPGQRPSCAPASRPPRSRRRRRPATRGSSSPRTSAAYDVAIESADHVGGGPQPRRMRAIARRRRRTPLRWTVGALRDVRRRRWPAGSRTRRRSRTANLELGVQIGEPDAFTFFAGQYFVIGTFAGRHDELLPAGRAGRSRQPGHPPVQDRVRDHLRRRRRHRDGPGIPGRGHGERLRASSPSTTSG